MAVQRVILRQRWPKYISILFPVWFFFAFFTQIKLVPGLSHNIGAFEFVGLAIALCFLVNDVADGGLEVHPLLGIAAYLTLVAGISQLSLPASNRQYGLVQMALLLFFLVFLFINHNLCRKYHLPLGWLLQIIIVAAVFAGVFVLFQGVQSSGDIQAAGPFRNRAHMGSYMLTAFWLCLIGTLWPSLNSRVRMLGVAGTLLSLYCVAVSGRRSVYLALFLGITALLSSIVATKRGKRLQWLAMGLLAMGFLLGLYRVGSDSDSRASFFRDRVGMIGGHLGSFLGVDEDLSAEKSFFAIQREGVLMAFRASPLMGIGWGGFPRSQYSPTGHEVHSTPMRLLAELGLTGLALYLYFMFTLLARSLRLYWKMRPSPYGNSYLALTIGIWTLSVSYIYNRHITERTFWILLAIFFAMEVFAADWYQLREQHATPTRRPRSLSNSGVPNGVLS